MILKTGFDKFMDKINLDKTRIERLQSAHNELRDVLREHEEIKKYYINDYLHGSYALHMGIKPTDTNARYDGDILLELNLKDDDGNYIMEGYSVILWLYNILKEIPAYKDKVEYPNSNARSVKIKYSKDLALDISPVHFNDDNDSVLIPPDWKETNPKGFKTWCIDTHKASDNQFYFITRIEKFWRDIQFGSGSHPKSILLTTLIGKHVSTKKDITLMEALVLSMDYLNRCFQAMNEVPEVCNPSLDSENLAERWSYSDFYYFKQKYNEATIKIKEALAEPDEQKTIELLNSDELFKGNFPVTLYEKELKEAIKMTEAIKAGKVGITKLGALTTITSHKVADVSSKFGSHGDF